MPWRAKLFQSFGPNGGQFAADPETEAIARQVVAEAKREGASKDDVAKEVVYHAHSVMIMATIALEPYLSIALQRLDDLW
ncbi:hypothetical protein sos41_31720 [Alphaproteobacteria bacterium SO-S41]|nr:hypothetical protein sos41_31720 [Alphaproteobacteria bacterium SO-S41]